MTKVKRHGNPKGQQRHDWPAPIVAYVALETKHPALVQTVRNLAKKKKTKRA